MKSFQNIHEFTPENWLENWENTIEIRINQWVSDFGGKTQKLLDLSSESLIIAEKIFIERYQEPYPLFIPENFFFLDGYNTYLGEVYKSVLKRRQLYWVCSKNKEEYFLPHLASDNYYNSEIFLYDNFMSAISERTGKTAYIALKATIKYWSENESLDKKKDSDTIIRMEGTFDTSYDHFILLKNNEFEFERLKAILEGVFTGLKIEHTIRQPSNHILYLKLNDKYLFQFHLNEESHVLEESKEMAERYEEKEWSDKTKEEIAQCASRIEFYGDEDDNGNYLNEYTYILDELVKDSNLLIYSFQHGAFYDEI